MRVCLLAASLCFSGVVHGQQVLSEGQRVRVTLAESQRQEEAPFRRGLKLRGEIATLGSDSIWLRLGTGVADVAIARASIMRLDRSLGVPSRWENALRWGIMFAFAGAIYTGLGYDRQLRDFGVINRSEAVALGAGFGFAYGALWGAVVPTERWRRVPAPLWR